MADVFLSYSSADAETAGRLAGLLTAAGYDVWWDRHLVSGERFQRSIERELAAASAVLVLWTPSSVGSEWVYSEARRGSQRSALVQVRARGRHRRPARAVRLAALPYADDDAELHVSLGASWSRRAARTRSIRSC
jgi:TIR domain